MKWHITVNHHGLAHLQQIMRTTSACTSTLYIFLTFKDWRSIFGAFPEQKPEH